MPPKRKNGSKGGPTPAKAAKKAEQTPIYVSIADGPKNLDTLPQVPMNLICQYLASAGDLTSIFSLHKVSFFLYITISLSRNKTEHF